MSDDYSPTNSADSKISSVFHTSAGFSNVIEEVNRKIAFSTCTGLTQRNLLKILVSKQKNRFNFDGFDLDLTCFHIFVTSSYFSFFNRCNWKNNCHGVSSWKIGINIPEFHERCRQVFPFHIKKYLKLCRFFNLRHPQHYRVYNL